MTRSLTSLAIVFFLFFTVSFLAELRWQEIRVAGYPVSYLIIAVPFFLLGWSGLFKIKKEDIIGKKYLFLFVLWVSISFLIAREVNNIDLYDGIKDYLLYVFYFFLILVIERVVSRNDISQRLLKKRIKLFVYSLVAFYTLLYLYEYISGRNINDPELFEPLFYRLHEAITLFFLLALLQISREFFGKFTFYGLSLLIIVFIVLLQSRTAWVGLIVFYSVVALLGGSLQKKAKAMVGCLLFISALSLYPGIQERLVKGLNSIPLLLSLNYEMAVELKSDPQRAILLSGAYEIGKQNIIFGIGPGYENLRSNFPLHLLSILERERIHGGAIYRPHNLYAGSFAHYGLVGLLLFVLYLVVPIKKLYKKLKNVSEKERERIIVTIGFLISIIVMYSGYQFETTPFVYIYSVILIYLPNIIFSASVRSSHPSFDPGLRSSK